MKFGSMQDFRSAREWFDGGMEIYVTIIFATSNNTVGKVTKIFRGPDRDFVDRPLFGQNVTVWFDIDLEIVTWLPELQGSNMLYVWLEHDDGTETTYSTSLSTEITEDEEDPESVREFNGGISIKVTDKDNLLGESIVEYCDDTVSHGYTYDTGSVLFQVNQQ